jgi:hypothetical protein
MAHSNLTRRTIALLVTITVVFTWAAITLPTRLAANLGWIYLARAILDVPAHQPHLNKANGWFFLSTSSHIDSAYIGADIAAILQRGEHRPNKSHDPMAASRFLPLAEYFEREDDLEYAVGFYSWATEFDTSNVLYDVRLGQFCRQHRDVFNENFPNSRQTCEQWLRSNQNNWFVNPNFEGEGIPGWSLIPSKREIRADLAVRAMSSSDNSILTMTSRSPLIDSNAFCQRTSLIPNEVVEFSATVETLPGAQDAMDVSILYIGWRDAQDRSQGNQSLKITTASPQTFYRRQFVLPDGANSDVWFCPIVVRGKGQVSISNVQLESLDGKH